MNINTLKAALLKAGIAASVLLAASGAALAQQQINLTAGPSTLTLPDGSAIPMWGYSCGAVVSGSTASCAALNGHAAAGTWSPIVITVPTGQDLVINLTNNLANTTVPASFASGVAIPTSLTIVGQLGGGLGSTPTRTASPPHNQLGVTWSTTNTPGVNSTNTGYNPTFTPPPQGARVQSFGTEVVGGNTATGLCWGKCGSTTAPSMPPGTYLLESGTHPSIQVPMGLIGMVVVTTAPSATAPAANTCNPAPAANAGTAYCASPTNTAVTAVTYSADADVLMSEIDPVQNTAVAAAVSTAGFSETRVWSGQVGQCGNPGAPVGVVNTCYPPAVDYTPLYYLINGVAYDKTNPTNSSIPITLATTPGNILVRLANAGLRMHVPSIVGSQTTGVDGTGAAATTGGFALVAEDGNPLPPAKARVQSDVFMAAGKTYDVMISSPAAGATALPVFDRQLSLSANAIEHDAGMLAYLSVNGAALPNSAVTAQALNDSYASLIAGQSLTVSDPSKGVIANDINVSGVTLLAQATNGTVSLNRNGTFTYTPNSGSTATSDSFTYCANGSVSGTTCSSGLTATVTLGAATLEAGSGITVNNMTFNSNVGCPATGCAAGYPAVLAIKPPGVLAVDSDGQKLPLSVATATVSALSGPAAGTLKVNADGSFSASVTMPGTYTFAYNAQNTQNVQSASQATITLVFPTSTGLSVTVTDPVTHANVTDYRWVIEEDQTFYINPACTTNNGNGTGATSTPPPGCPQNGIVPTLGVNFHTSHMPFVAAGCTGTMSCEGGQKVYDNNPASPTFGQHIAAVCDIGNGVCRPDTTGNGFAPLQPSQVALDPSKRYYISVLPGDAAQPFTYAYSGNPNCQKDLSGNIIPSSTCGHGMGGAPIGPDPNTGAAQTGVTILTQPSPYPPAKLSVFVFEDDFPLNGEQDGGGGIDVLSPQEPGLGGFQIHLWDAMAGNGDFTGQMTYDMFNQPLTNSLDGTIDPATGLNACPITNVGIANPGTNAANGPATLDKNGNPIVSQTAGITGMIVTCPKYESDGATLSPLAGQAVVANLMPMRMGVVATPGAERIARGEEWLQTNTLDGQKAHDAFVRIGEPSYFQEFGPASFHVSIGFANPAIINARRPFVCNGSDANVQAPNNQCLNTIVGRVVGERLSRTPDERLYGSGSHDAFVWTQCYVSFGDPDGEDFAFTKCDADGRFTLNGLPDGSWRVTTFDQWNDQLVDGLSTPVGLGAAYPGTPGNGTTTNPTPANLGPSNCPGPATTKNPVKGSPMTCDMGDIAATQWETNLQTVTFIDDNKDGVHQSTEGGIPLANVAVRLRDGSLENLLQTDFTGTANFNETFPLFSWYVVETDTTRYKNTGTHVVYDVGGPADDSLSTCGGPSNVSGTGFPACGTSTIAKYLANTAELVSLPNGLSGGPNLRVPGSVYCADADCSTHTGGGTNGIQWAATGGSNPSDQPSICTTNATTGGTTCSTQLSSGRVDNPWYGGTEGWQGFPGQFSFLEFGKEPYAPHENGGIQGHVVYASTRPFDDPMMLVQTQWTPLIPNVTINLYQEGYAADGVTPTLTLVDTTQTSSWDKWAQGFHTDANGNTVPNMNCPGQGGATGTLADLFFFSLYNQPDWLDLYAQEHAAPGLLNPAATGTALPYNSQFKCYDGMHNWNQVQPAPYDGMYQFPSITAVDPTSGKPTSTNCKICSANNLVPTTDLYYGLPMLPPGKYVVEVVVPPGFELVKEEDKNILIGDNYIAPVTQQFGGIGNVFIIPDQASVAQVNGPYANTYAGVAYNANNSNTNGNNNGMNPTVSLGASPQTGLVPGFTPEPVWPCAGALRVVPDYISLYPTSQQVAPFAGASRPLCDRKEVTLEDQMHVTAKFYLFTSAHLASKFTGGITDDYTSEFDPFSPQFGEKFSPPDLPVSVRDWSGTETNRVYADHWGAYNGMTYSTWEVNPPNPTGYSPSMMVFCMNDPGPILDTRPTVNGSVNPTLGQMITDPLFTQGYSQFCYELPFMPATTQYLDTPVVPTSAFAGAGYNNVDCAYPTLTPAIRSVVNTATESNSSGSLPAGSGPWVAKALDTVTITALGDTSVPNNAYSGPSATKAPFNQKTILRHYGFGTATGTVTIGGKTATVVGSWGDQSLTVQVPPGLPQCTVQQQLIYMPAGTTGGDSKSYCGELVVTTSTGQKSVDAVTVTVGGKVPTVVSTNNSLQPNAPGSIQATIDAAAPGDMIIVPPGTHYEMILMWKPVRLQGVGAASSIIDASTQPAGKLDHWRAQVDCLFGIAMNGQPIGVKFGPAPAPNGFDPTKTYSCPMTDGPAAWAYFVGPTDGSPGNGSLPQVDRLPLEATLGWDASQNGNMAELLQEPSLMGALEGAAITVLSKGVDFHGQNPYDPTLLAGFPTATTLLSATTCLNAGKTANPNPSSFWCNPSGIDGLGIQESSQGGGGIFVHAWGHNLQIANNRINDNAGTLSGGINVGQGEFPPAYIRNSTTNAAPGSCEDNGSYVTNQQEPYCHNMYVNVHHNYISLNSSTGDELFSATPAGAGGVSFCTGADYYQFDYNWVCGNLSSGDGGGFGHMGFSKNGDIEYNTFVFNQSLNPTIPANGGGLIIMGSPDADPTCGSTTDADCQPTPSSIGPSDGIGPGLVINANLIMGNAAEAGTGGGVAFQSVNGSEVVAFPTQSQYWYQVQFTNNIVTNNVAGWDGGGISLEDSLNVNIVNNTIASNVTTATAGVLFNTLGAPIASQQNGANNCYNAVTGTSACGNSSAPQPAGLVAIQNSAVLQANLPATVTCPAGHYAGTTGSNGSCRHVSYPELYNNVFWQNAAYFVGVGATPFVSSTPVANTLYQQNIVTLYNAFTQTPTANQTATGQCVAASYWDIGVRGDTGPSNHGSGFTLAPAYSVLTDAGDYPASLNNLPDSPMFVQQYCDGSRQPPEFGASGWAVPPGISDATVPNPVFNLTPVATVDEGNNWVNLRWGPLTMVNPVSGAILGNYSQAAGSPVIDYIPANASTYKAAPSTDFFGNARKTDGHVDVGAVEYQTAVTTPIAILTPSSLSFGNGVDGTTSAAQTLTLRNDGGAALTGVTLGALPAGFSRPTGGAGGNCGATLAAGASCTINVVFAPNAVQSYGGNLTITATNATVDGSPVALSGAGVAAVVTAGVSPSPLAFGNWASGTTSSALTLTVTNTGNVALAGGTFTFGGGTPQPFSRPGGGAGGTCGATLAVGASCTINVVFAPATATAFSQTLTVAYTGATVTPTPVTLTGTGVPTRATLSITPLTITLPTGALSGTGTVTLTNTAAAAGGSDVAVSNVAVSGGTLTTYFFSKVAGADKCTGTTLAPGASCTVGVRFTNVLSARGTNRAGTITFTDTGAGSPQAGGLGGFATP